MNAFDSALLDAGLGNINLVKVSSILPPAARRVDAPNIPPGSLVPVAYAAITEDRPGVTLAAAVAIGFGEPGEYGVIMELGLEGTRAEVDARIREMVVNAFTRRGRRLTEILVASVEHEVDWAGCAFAAVAMWY